jgi:hypothetical protein
MIAWNGFLVRSNPSSRERKDLQYFSCWTIINWDMLSFFEIMSLFKPQALLKMKISFRIFFLISAYSPNMQNVLKCLPRMRGKHTDVIKLIWRIRRIQGCLQHTKSSPNTWKVLKRIQKILGKNLCVHGEDT